ncbi:MAG TPA: SGNH/GDSL hydrolase family protein, partial [Sporichthyaceae bacterium]
CMCFGPLAERFSNDRQHFSPDVIIIDAGRNDPPSDATHQAIDNYFAAVRAAWPKATIVDIIPYFVTSTTPSKLTPWLTAAAVRNHATIEDPFSRGWAGYSVSGGQAGPDHVHPTADGYRYIAEHLTADFRAMGLPAADASAGHPAVSLASPS